MCGIANRRAYFQFRISLRFCCKIPNPEPQIREISDRERQIREILDPKPQIRETDPEHRIREVPDPDNPVGDLYYKTIFLRNVCLSQLEYQRQQLLAERQQFHQEQLKAAEIRVRAAAGHLSPSASSPGHLQPQPQVSQPQPQFPQQRQPQQHRPVQQPQSQGSQPVVAGHNVSQAPSPSPQGKDSGKLPIYSSLTFS